jgi:CheY-like chemotaxis protein
VRSAEAIDVLLVDDDVDDVLVIEEVLAGWWTRTILHVANDGVEATAFLRREGFYAHAPRPRFLLLDVNMPRLDSFGILEELGGDDRLSRIPILVFSTSEACEHVLRSYSAYANAYLVKPARFDDVEDAVREIDDFYAWVLSRPPAPDREIWHTDDAYGW